MFAGVGTALSMWLPTWEISHFAPGTPVRFVIGGFMVATVTIFLTSACAIFGMVVERRFWLNTLFICIALSSFPLARYSLFHSAAVRGVILEP
jgi:hypothetical protein